MDFWKEEKKNIGVWIFLFIFIAVSFLFSLWNKNRENKNERIESPSEAVVKKIKNYFNGLNLEAKSAFVWDAKEKKVIYSLNEETQLPLASVTKLMTALISSELVPEGTILTINSSDIAVEGDSGFSIGEKWTFSNLLDFTLITSSNDGAHALASVIGYVKPKEENKTEREMFIDEMNKRARKMGLTQTYFLNESGLDLSDGTSGAYGSAKDIALLMAEIVKAEPDILKATKYSDLEIKSKDFIYEAKNTNQSAESTPGIIGSKTGYTDLAGGNLVVSFDISIGHPIVISVLGSSYEGRFEDIQKLIQATLETFGN